MIIIISGQNQACDDWLLLNYRIQLWSCSAMAKIEGLHIRQTTASYFTTILDIYMMSIMSFSTYPVQFLTI